MLALQAMQTAAVCGAHLLGPGGASATAAGGAVGHGFFIASTAVIGLLVPATSGSTAWLEPPHAAHPRHTSRSSSSSCSRSLVLQPLSPGTAPAPASAPQPQTSAPDPPAPVAEAASHTAASPAASAAAAGTSVECQTDDALLRWLFAGSSAGGLLDPGPADLAELPGKGGSSALGWGKSHVGKYDSFTSVWSRSTVTYGGSSQRVSIAEEAVASAGPAAALQLVVHGSEDAVLSAGSSGNAPMRCGSRLRLERGGTCADLDASHQQVAPHGQVHADVAGAAAGSFTAPIVAGAAAAVGTGALRRAPRRSHTFSTDPSLEHNSPVELATITEGSEASAHMDRQWVQGAAGPQPAAWPSAVRAPHTKAADADEFQGTFSAAACQPQPDRLVFMGARKPPLARGAAGRARHRVVLQDCSHLPAIATASPIGQFCSTARLLAAPASDPHRPDP